MFLTTFSRTWHALSWTKAWEVTALTSMLWLDDDVALKINNSAWPWHFFSTCLNTYLCTTVTVPPSVESHEHPAERLVRSDGKRSCVFATEAKARARKWTLGMRKFKSAADLEPGTTAPWILPNMGKNSCHQANTDGCWSFSSRIFWHLILISHQK